MKPEVLLVLVVAAVCVAGICWLAPRGSKAAVRATDALLTILKMACGALIALATAPSR